MNTPVKRTIAILVGVAICTALIGVALFYRSAPAGSDLAWETPLKSDLEKLADSLNRDLIPWKVPDHLIKVEDFGAVAGTARVQTAAIQRAIDACSAKGGGVVLFSRGDYTTGTIELRSGVMIEVAKNARILGSTDLRDYPEKIEHFKSVMSENYRYRQSLIYAENCDGVGIRGEGEIWFRGEKENFPGPENATDITGRPFGIRMIQCRHVVLQVISLRNAAAWMQSYLDCRDLIFDGIRVENQANFNNDGLDLDGCTNVIVRNCFISSEDDALCLKGASGKPSQNILIERSTFVSSCNALKIGTDTQGDFRNIVARDLILGGIPEPLTAITGHEAISGVTLATVDGGNVENILISDVSINRVGCPVFLRIGKRGRVMTGTAGVGYLKHIVIENVTGDENLGLGSFISGIKGHYVEDVIIRNYKINTRGGGDASLASSQVAEAEDGYPDARLIFGNGSPAYGFFIRHARRITFIGAGVTTLIPDARPEFASGGDVVDVFANGHKLN